MFAYDNLLWSITFPVTCAVMMWFSMALALLGRGRDAWCRRERARVFIEDSIRLLLSRESHSNEEEVGRNTNDAADMDGVEATGKVTRSSHLTNIIASDGKTSTNICPNVSDARVVCDHGGLVCSLTVPTAALRATKAVIRRAVVVVGGDFARSPRMQHHAASLARCGLFDEVILVGLNAGNALSEDLLSSGEATPMWFGLRAGRPCAVEKEGSMRARHNDSGAIPGQVDGVRTEHTMIDDVKLPYSLGCEINTRYLVSPPRPPSWLRWLAIGPLRWLVRTSYAVLYYTFTFTLLLLQTMVIRVNEEGQLLLTDIVLVQTPPAIPFILLLRYVARPLALVYNSIIYYGFIVPASWLYMDAMRDLREECALHRDDDETVNDSSDKVGKDNDLLASIEHVRRARLRDLLASSPSTSVQRAARAARGRVFCPAILVDWHNLGYTIMQQARRPRWSCALYRLLELGLCAGDVNLTVSQAMRTALRRLLWQLPALSCGTCKTNERDANVTSNTNAKEHLGEKDVVVLYDRAPACFAPHSRRHFVQHVLCGLSDTKGESTGTSTSSARQAVSMSSGSSDSNCNKSGDGWGIAPPPAWVYDTIEEADSEEPQRQTSSHEARATPHKGSTGTRPAHLPHNGLIVVGSTSWTEDDDYSVVIAALQRLDVRLTHIHRYLSYAQKHEARRRTAPHDQANHHHHYASATSHNDSMRTSHSVSGTTDTLSASYGNVDHVSAGRMMDGGSYADNGDDDSEEADFVIRVADGTRASRRLNSPAYWRHRRNNNDDTSTAITGDDTAAATRLTAADQDNNNNSNSTGNSPTTGPPPLWVLITGKGPARRRFEDAVREARLSSHITVSTLYLQSYADYIVTLGAADVGLCLHYSSSGYDLPMKGVDMIGAGLPVIARRYDAINELMGPDMSVHTTGNYDAVQQHTSGTVECERGWLFSTAEELEEILAHLLGLHAPYWREFVCTPNVVVATAAASKRRGGNGSALTWSLAEARQAVQARRAQTATWEQSWNATLLPVIHALT